jgi:hypothetical protein
VSDGAERTQVMVSEGGGVSTCGGDGSDGQYVTTATANARQRRSRDGTKWQDVLKCFFVESSLSMYISRYVIRFFLPSLFLCMLCDRVAIIFS